jgi:YebC/PmpR family DNA-binding regulatory protein
VAGHSKWAQIKRKKAKEDAKRGQLFGKLAKEITVAARLGGADLDANPRLRLAVQQARTANMPQDGVERAIKRGTGDIEGIRYEEAVYEAYGPGGVAICIEAMTDNKNRTTPELRRILEKWAGRLGEVGSVMWMFDRIGLIIVEKESIDENELFDIIADAGADDLKEIDDAFEVYTPIELLSSLTEELERRGIIPTISEVSLIAKSSVRVDGDDARKLLALLDELGEHEDVQKVFANFEIPPEVFEELTGTT